jgi:hypothetical protein
MIQISKANQLKYITGTLSVETILTNCTGGLDNGVIVVVPPPNGTAPFRYVIDRSEPQSSNSFTGLENRNYVIQVVDKFGKLGWQGVTIFDNVDCGTYAGSIWSDLASNKWGQYALCQWDDFN